MNLDSFVCAVSEKINQARAALNIPAGCIFQDEETGDLRLDLEFWRENARTLTTTGRAEIQAEQTTAEQIIGFCRQFATVERDGGGSGYFGSIESYFISLN